MSARRPRPTVEARLQGSAGPIRAGRGRLTLAGARLRFAVPLALLLCAWPARPELIWALDPTKGTGQFKQSGQGNCEDGGSITAFTDPQRGSVMRWLKPAASNRCENHGITVGGKGYVFQEGSTYYFGWWSKLSHAGNNNANFQWKSYGDHIQNFPVILKMINGRMTLQYRNPPPNQEQHTVWSAPLSAGAWNHYALALHTSKDARLGWIEFWFNGAQQSLTGGTTRYAARTWDSGDHNCPKWGIYGAQGTEMANYIDDAKVGTDYASVAMEGAIAILPGPIRPSGFRDVGLTPFDAAGRLLPLGQGPPSWRTPSFYPAAP